MVEAHLGKHNGTCGMYNDIEHELVYAESGVENVHQIQRETGGLDNIPALFYSYNHKMLRMEYSVLSYLSFRLSTEMWATYVDLNCSSCISFNG
jgi:hypothetical protein